MSFQASDIQRICGVKRLRLHQWMEEGFISPSIQRASGHGTRNVWSKSDLYRILLLKRLIENGFHRKAAATILNSIDFEEVHKTLDGEYLRGQGSKKWFSSREDLWLVICREWSDGDDQKTYYFAYPYWAVRTSPGFESRTLDVRLKIAKDHQFAWDDAVIINIAKLVEKVDAKM